MALATRELELVIIARDRTSAVLARVGGALAVLGAGAARLGAEGIGFFVESTKGAIDFRKQVALAFTQVEIAGATFDDTLNLIRDSARQTAVPIEELTDSAFDIFSTLTLDNMDQARVLLDLFAQSAVAGDAPIRDIGRATIAWLNALNMAPTAENATRILENQFELVRKGAGTYTEFATVMGKAIPPFVAANQTVETMSASLAFLTRNGLSAAEASTSASRAVELLFGPKAIKGLDALGIEILDNNGRFRDMRGLLGDIVEEFSGLDDAEKKLKFKETFGQGRIQARRFFDLILAEGNFEEWIFLLDAVEAGAGNVAGAFDIMSATSAVQIEVLKNRFQVLRDEIGDVFIPLLVGKLLPALDRILDAWEEMDDLQKDNLVKWAAFATLAFTIAGAITAVTGAIILIVGLMQAFTGSLIVTGLLLGGWVVAVAAIAGAIALAILDWDKFVEIFGPWWDKILDKMQPVVDWLKEKWPAAWAIAEDAWDGVVTFFEDDWPRIWENVKTAFTNVWDFLVGLWEENIKPAFDGFGTFFEERLGVAGDAIGSLMDNSDKLIPLWEAIRDNIGPILTTLARLFVASLTLIIVIITTVLAIAARIWDEFGDDIVAFMVDAWNLIVGLWISLVTLITGIFNLFSGLLTGDWDLFWTGLSDIMGGVIGLILTVWHGFWLIVATILSIFIADIRGKWDTFWDGLETKVSEVAGTILGWIGRIIGGIANLNPFLSKSPSLVDNVTKGYAQMKKVIGNDLAAIDATANRLVPKIAGTLGRLDGSQLVSARVTPLPGIPLTAGQPSIGQQINIDKLESKADPFEIASEIGWQALNS